MYNIMKDKDGWFIEDKNGNFIIGNYRTLEEAQLTAKYWIENSPKRRDFNRSLLKLTEECAEVQTAAIKVIDFGPSSIWPIGSNNPSNRDQLVQEIGDLLAVIDVIKDEIGLEISNDEIEIAKEKKKIKLLTYLPYI